MVLRMTCGFQIRHFGSLCNFKLSKRWRIWKHTTKDETDDGPPKKVKPPDVKKQNINTDKKRLSNNNQKKGIESSDNSRKTAQTKR